MQKKIKIGSHVSMCAPEYFLGSVKEMLSYEANSLMIYTGAPQNTIRKDIQTLKINEGLELLKQSNINNNNIVVHAPYIINLCSDKIETRQLAIDFLKKELERTKAFGSKYLVLHPGSRLSQDLQTGIEQIIFGINECLSYVKNDVIICLETMAGKGSEVGSKFQEIKNIIDGVEKKDRIAVCLDTCHINDAGYDLNNLEVIIKEFEEIIGIEYLKVIHLNDSKNPLNSHKDRHENIGYGTIGFNNLINVVYHEKFKDIIKILETPYVSKDDKKPYPIYKEEIEMILKKEFNPNLK